MIKELQRKIYEMDSEKLNLKMKCTSTEHHLRSRENELADKEQQLSKQQEAREREKMLMKDHINQKTEKLTKEFQQQKSQMVMDMWQRDRRLRKEKKILDGGPGSHFTPSTASSDTDIAQSCEPQRHHNRPLFQTSSKCAESALDLASSKPGRGLENMAAAAAVVNPRTHRRSRSAGPGDVWLDHQPPNDGWNFLIHK